MANPGSSKYFSSDALPVGCFALMEWNSSFVQKRVVPGWRVSIIISNRKDYDGHIRNPTGKKQALPRSLTPLPDRMHCFSLLFSHSSLWRIKDPECPKSSWEKNNNARVVKYPKSKFTTEPWKPSQHGADTETDKRISGLWQKSTWHSWSWYTWDHLPSHVWSSNVYYRQQWGQPRCPLQMNRYRESGIYTKK